MNYSKNKNHQWKFVQNGGLIQAKISTIDDILNLEYLDPKYWTVLSCPVNGLEFSEETLSVIDAEKKGRVSVPDILNTINYIIKYFNDASCILESQNYVSLSDLGEEPFDCGYKPIEAAKKILDALKKSDQEKLNYDDIAKAIKVLSEKKMDTAQIIKKESINNKDAADIYLTLKDKIDEYFLKCSIINYDISAKDIFKGQCDALISGGEYSNLPIAVYECEKPLPLVDKINPLWKSQIDTFKKLIVNPLYGKTTTELSESQWKEIQADFSDFINWYKSEPNNNLLQACYELKKMILIRRDFYELLVNFISFEKFYSLTEKAMFQCGTLYIDGRSCDLCFKVPDIAKHSSMAALSQCYLLYCDCVKQNNKSEKMQIAALVSNGSTDNLLIGRNGILYDRKGATWDATIVKIVENPISIRQAFWSPYKKLGKMIQEKIAKSTSDAEKNVFDKMSKAVENPKDVANTIPSKKTDVGTVAAISVAFTGIATVVGGLLQAFFGLGVWIPLGIIGIILVISLPSMLIAWRKLRQRNIAPILDASGWAVNGNVKIPALLGTTLTKLPVRPASAYLSLKDPFANKKHTLKKVIIISIIVIIIAVIVFLGIKNPDVVQNIWNSLASSFHKAGESVQITN